MNRRNWVILLAWFAWTTPQVLAEETPTHTGDEMYAPLLPMEAEEAHGSNGHAGSHDTGHEDGHGGGHHSVAWYLNADLWKTINLAILFFLIARYGGAQITKGVRGRTHEIRSSIETAAQALQAAEKAMEEADYRLAKLHDELDEMRSESQKLGQAEKEKTIADAKELAKSIREAAQSQVTALQRGAERELREYAAEQIVQRVRKQLRERVEQQGDTPFVHSLLEKVEALA